MQSQQQQKLMVVAERQQHDDDRLHVASGNIPLSEFNNPPNFALPQLISKIVRSLSPSSSSSSAKNDDNEESKQKPRILYIDDEVRIAQVIKYGLEKYGFVVDTFNHPKTALASFKKGAYDLLLIDVRLPEIDGLDLCNELLKIDNSVKVCFIKAYELGQEEIKNRVAGLETECVVKKPVSFETLVSKINRELNRNNN